MSVFRRSVANANIQLWVSRVLVSATEDTRVGRKKEMLSRYDLLHLIIKLMLVWCTAPHIQRDRS